MVREKFANFVNKLIKLHTNILLSTEYYNDFQCAEFKTRFYHMKLCFALKNIKRAVPLHAMKALGGEEV
jgi:hypothetical protein